MLKIILRVLIILVVFAAVAGGVYLLVQKSGTNLLANTQVDGGFHNGNGTRPADGSRPSGGDFDKGGEAGGVSTRNLSELGVNVGKVALITIGVVLVQGLIRFFRRRKSSTNPSAV
jgi:hypothetical protein